MKPEKLELCLKNTPIEKLRHDQYRRIWVKREDHTGIEISGNKIRKLEYALKEAIDQKSTMIITCGGIQSNHARATVAAAKKIGLSVHLVLRGEEKEAIGGNAFLYNLMGTKVTFLNPSDFSNHESYMHQLKVFYESQGEKAYIIPMGASNGIGNFGYASVFDEILYQEKMMNVNFDAIVCTVGSGGTYAGLCLGSVLNKSKKKIFGINITSDETYFINKIRHGLDESKKYLTDQTAIERIDNCEINIIDGYVGGGYAVADKALLRNIKDLATHEGLILDPVYTGKAFMGMMDQLDLALKGCENILFIHTGGLFGTFAYESKYIDWGL